MYTNKFFTQDIFLTLHNLQKVQTRKWNVPLLIPTMTTTTTTEFTFTEEIQAIETKNEEEFIKESDSKLIEILKENTKNKFMFNKKEKCFLQKVYARLSDDGQSQYINAGNNEDLMMTVFEMGSVCGSCYQVQCDGPKFCKGNEAEGEDGDRMNKFADKVRQAASAAYKEDNPDSEGTGGKFDIHLSIFNNNFKSKPKAKRTTRVKRVTKKLVKS